MKRRSLSVANLGRIHTGGERFFGVNGDVTSLGCVTP